MSITQIVWSWFGRVRRMSRAVCQDENGRWCVEKIAEPLSIRGAANFEFVPENTGSASSLVLFGQRHEGLRWLRRAVGPVFRLIYFDLPRLRVDDAATAFETESPLRLTTWLSLVRSFLIEAKELLSRQGVVAVHCGEDEAQYAKVVLDELFRDKRVGTVIWQKTYSARHMPGMKEFTDAHDLIYVYARDKEALPAVGLRKVPEGYGNSDGDPRGPWKAEHKGAKTRRENSDFDTYQPPYRWQVSEGDLPPGLWRVSPATGVVWGIPNAVGKYQFVVQVTDKVGGLTKRAFCIEIAESGNKPPPADIPWILEEQPEGGPLQITTQLLPIGVVGEEYSAIILAEGGAPFRGRPIRPGSGRFWDFAWATLLNAYRQDAVYLGRPDPTSIPTPKKYSPPAGSLEIENQQSIWLGRSREAGGKAEPFAGFTEDATKHLKALKELGAVATEVPTAKPEKLMLRLLEIFTGPGDLVLEPMSQSADMSAVTLKCGRRFVALQGVSHRDIEVSRNCALPRLKAVVSGDDNDLEKRAPSTHLSPGTYIPFEGGGSFAVAHIGPLLAVIPEDDDRSSLTQEALSMTSGDLKCAVLSAMGYLPPPAGARFALSLTGRGRAAFVPPGEILTAKLLAEIASEIEQSSGLGPAAIFYFRSDEELDEKLFQGLVTLRRVPFDLIQRGA